MGNKQRRIRFAKEVLNLLSEDAIEVAEGCGYFDLKLPRKISSDKELSKVLDRWLGEKHVKISLCALGSLFVAAVLHENKLKVKDLQSGDRFKQLNLDHFEIYDYLINFFSQDQLELIESAFEAADMRYESVEDEKIDDAVCFGAGISSDKKRLKAIMRNIIENDGKFVPPRVHRVARNLFSDSQF